jgi:TonB-dependent starch-binding outer membrane protein SusC
MKISMMVIAGVLLSTQLMLAKAAEGQVVNRKVTVSFENPSLYSSIRELERTSNIKFSYNTSELRSYTIVPRSFKDASLSEILGALLKNTNLSFTEVESSIVIFSKEESQSEAVELSESSVGKADIIVRGKVSDNQGPLPGVSVRVKGGSASTTTDIDGNYSINAPENGTLLFTYIGFEDREVAVNNQRTINITLTAAAKSLQEVVVVGYGTQRRGSVTGAVSTVSGSDIATSAVTGVGQAIQGKISGVQITRSSGAPGAGVDIRVRGEGTLNSGKGPLVIIDGIEGQDLNSVSPKDIESVTVLKDASAGAIYGSRAANGVVVVTTKRGKSGKPVIDYSYVLGSSELVRAPQLLNAKDFVRLQNEAIINGGGTPTWTDSQIANFGEGTNWLDAILQPGVRQEHNLSLRGGTDGFKFLISSSYLDEKGIVKFSSFKRVTGRVNLDAKVNDRLNVGLSAFVFNRRSPSSAQVDFSGAVQFVPTIPMYNEDGTPGYRMVGGPVNAENGGLNPLQAAEIGAQYTNYSPNTGTNSSAFVEYNFFPFLKFRTTGGLNLSVEHTKTFLPQYSVVDSKGGLVAERLLQNTQLTESNELERHWLVNNVLTFNKTFGNHNTSALLGHSEQYRTSEENQSERRGFPSNDFFVLDAGSNLLDRVEGNRSESSLRSFFGRVNYDFKNRYLIELVARYDGSSRFSPDKKYGLFPSASLGWRISDEAFFSPLRNLVNDLKLRASYGSVGNESIANFLYLQNVSLNNPYNFNNTAVSGAAFSGLRNPDLKWETTTTGNLGLDLSMFNSKVNVTIDAYNKLTKDILTSVPVPVTTGNFASDINAGTQVRNVGKVRNRGIELGINYADRIGSDWSYSVGFTGAYNQNRVMSLGAPGTVIFGDSNRSIIKVGYPMGSIYGTRALGVWQNWDEINSNPHQPNDQPGDLRLADLNGDGVVTSADSEPLGSSIPVYTLGINGDLRYKGFDFNISTQGDFDREILRFANGGYFEFASPTRNNFDYILNRWRGEGTSTAVPRVVNSEYNSGQASSFRVQNASYFKIRHLEFGYTLPALWAKKVKMSNLRLYIAGENLYTFTPFVGFDPERPQTVQRQNETYPQARTYLFGINTSF